MALCAAWVGGQKGEYRRHSRRSRPSRQCGLDSQDAEFLQLRLVDLATAPGQAHEPGAPLNRLVRALHERFTGQILGLVLMQLEGVYEGTLTLLTREQRCACLA